MTVGGDLGGQSERIGESDLLSRSSRISKVEVASRDDNDTKCQWVNRAKNSKSKQSRTTEMSARLEQANRAGAPRTMICARYLMVGLICLILVTSIEAHKQAHQKQQQQQQNRHQVSGGGRNNQPTIDRQGEHQITDDDFEKHQQRMVWLAAQQQQHQQQQHQTNHANHNNKSEKKKKNSNDKIRAEKQVGGSGKARQQQQQLAARGEKPAAGEQRRSELETLLALAANAARVGAIVSTADHQQQQQAKVTDKNAASNLAASELDSSDLIKSMQMINAGMPLAPPPPSPPPSPTTRQQNNKPPSAPKPSPVASERIMNEGEGASSNGGVSASLEDPTAGFDVVEAQNFAGGPQQTHQSFPEIITQQHQHHQLEHEQRHEPVGVDHPPPLPRRPHEHVETVHARTPPLLNDFHVVNSLPSALDDHNQHYGGQAHDHGYSPAQAYQPTSAGVDVTPSLKHQGIRVVFNNNPQFIIGANARDAADSYAAAASSPLQRKTRQPSASLYDADQYHQDESAPDETKVSVLPCAEKTSVQRPIQQHEELPKNIEKINIQEPVEPPPVIQQQVVEPPGKTRLFEPQQQQEQHAEEPPPPQVKTKSPPPALEKPAIKTVPTKSRPPPIVKQQQHVEPDDQIVDTPIEQVVKSGLRPPLRMVISMRNKHGDVMRVPVNLHGSTKLPPTKQAPAPELEPQMQIHFEKPPVVVTQLPPVITQQQQHDENTPIGGDIFDPGLTRPFETKGKTRVGIKSPPVIARPPVSKTPEVKIPQVQEPEQQVVEEPPIKTIQSPPVPPVVKTKQVVVKEPPPLPEPEAQVKEVAPHPPPPQVKVIVPPKTPSKTQHVATKRPDCHQQQQVIEPIEPQQQIPAVKETPQVVEQLPQQQQQQQAEEQVMEQQQAVVGPSISLSPSNDGIVHMMMPKLTQFQNKTFANMFSQFQDALSEHMTNHLASEAAAKAASEEQSRRREDEQEDLMVALMAANRSPPMESRQPLSMTVIKPPRGMSLQEALRSHAREGQTMAILSTSGAASVASAQPTGEDAAPVGFDVLLRPAPDGTTRQNVPSPRTRVESNNRQQPSTSVNQDQPEGGVDPDGFSSSSSSSASSFDRPDSSESSLARLLSSHDIDIDAPLDWLRHREYNTRQKRDLSSDMLHRHLEADDKLPKPKSSNSPGALGMKGRHKNGTTAAPRRTDSSKLSKKTVAAARSPSYKLNKSKQQPKRAPQAPTKSTANNKRQQRNKPSKTEPDFMASASHQNEVSSADSGDDDEDASAAADQSNSDEAEEDEPSSYSSSSSNDEPAASASGEGGSESSGSSPSGGDDGDYNGDMGDDFEDSAGSFGEGDDEPYNQAAASDRDYSGASSTFEIPSIDINPDTLQQKGCRTVLREVHEIPMNGLGAVRADGQPGSGYGGDHQASATSAHSLGGLRVRRQAVLSGNSNSNLLNSRKVTSVVMTKECHFPNDAQDSTTKSKRTPARVPVSRQQVDPVAFGGQSGASRARPTVVMPQQPPPIVQQQQQQQQRLAHAYQILEGAGQKSLPAMTKTNTNTQQQQQLLAQLQQQQQAQRMISANFYASPQHAPASGQLVQYRLAPQQIQRHQQPLVSASSTIKRRSVAPLVMQAQQQQLQQHKPVSVAPRAPLRRPASQDDIYVGAASGVVAKKLYKPPSEDDPYHTLSYSSQTGADPDMEEDEDDSVVMGGEPSASDGDERASSSSQKRSRETLSDRERSALTDPNHDDTDPEVRSINRARQGRKPSAPSAPAGRRQQAPESQNTDDADETDGDLADESRVRGLAERRAPPGPWQFTGRAATAAGARNQRQQPIMHHQRQAPVSIGIGGGPVQRRAQQHQQVRSRSDAQSQHESPARYGKSFRFEHELSRLPTAIGGRRTAARSLAPLASHYVTAAQLRQLRPGLQGYVATNGQRQQAAGPQLASQLKALAAGAQPRYAARRQDMDDDDDDDDDDGDDDSGGGGGSGRRGRGSAAAPSRRQEARAAGDDDNPDADPELNPRESHLPAHSKPKKFEKSFAYVHRDLPKAGAKNPDDFIVSYGRGNLQTEHEDYDSDRDPNNSAPPTSEDQDRAASLRHGAKLHAPLVSWPPRHAAPPRQLVANGAQGVRSMPQSHHRPIATSH